MTLTANPERLPADGESRSDLAATLEDRNGNPIPEKEILFKILKGEGYVEGSGFTDASGMAPSAYTAPYIPGNVVLDYAYDAEGNRLSTTDNLGGTNAYQYDQLNRVESIEQSGTGVTDKLADFAYDAAGQMTGISRWADLAGTALVAASTYTFDPFDLGFVEILAAQQTIASANWYQGTADAVRQNLRYLQQPHVEHVLILSGDQLYRMNFKEMIATHKRTKADVTISAVPVYSHQALGLGDGGEHIDELALDKLEGGDRNLKLQAFAGVRQSCHIAVCGCADSTPGDAVASLVETRKGRPEPACGGQSIALWHAHLIQD